MSRSVPPRGVARGALIGVLVALHALYLVGDRSWWGEAASVWPPLLWLLATLPLALLLRCESALVLALLLSAAHGEWPRGSGADALQRDEAGRLRVAVWNVSLDPESWRWLRRLDPDLVLVQESPGPPGPAWDGFQWLDGGDLGALSRHPVQRLASRGIGPWVEPLLFELRPPGAAPLLVANVRLVQLPVVMWLAGGFRESPWRGQRHRLAQLPALARLVEETRSARGRGPALIAGDFNAPARLPSFAPLRERFVDAWRVGGVGWGATATAGLPLARIDQCWVTPEIEVASARVRRLPVSDHRLLWVELKLPAAGPSRSQSGSASASGS